MNSHFPKTSRDRQELVAKTLSKLTVIIGISFVLVVIARWFHPALFDIEVSYWLAGLAVVAGVAATFLSQEKAV